MLRSDYVLDCDDLENISNNNIKIKQVKLFVTSASMAGLGTQCTRLHRFNLENLGKQDIAANLPECKAVENMAKVFAEAWRMYGNKKAAIMLIIRHNSTTVTDQRWLEYEIRHLDKSIPIIRRGFKDIIERAKLVDNKLIIDDYEIGIVYYRTGYLIEHYPTDKEWEARLMIEKSLAIKCPSIGYRLACITVLKQEIFRSGSIERLQKYFPDGEDAINRIRDLFPGLYTLDMDSEGSKNVQKALQNPNKYVLKSRKLEGDTLYDEDLVSKLNELGEDKRRAEYVLIDRIKPPVVKNYIVQSGKDVENRETVSEIGIFAAIISQGENLLINSTCGHILKTKTKSYKEGGASVDNAVEYIDSPFLV
ncbi:glutathione synthetase-like [Saccoglossus kowalevskii]